MTTNNAVRVLGKDIARQRPNIEDGTVVRFKAKAYVSGREYTYAAVFVASKWFLTGYGTLLQTDATHEEFVKILADKNVSEIEVAIEWNEVER